VLGARHVEPHGVPGVIYHAHLIGLGIVDPVQDLGHEASALSRCGHEGSACGEAGT
jgi:hypothetical protein